jgi:hypothetical protein
MEPVRVKQFYGYAVCLIAVVTFLFSARALLEAAINLSNPFQASGRFGGPVASSFEGYLAWYRERPAPPGTARDTASVETLRARWQALRDEQVARARFDATRSVATSALLLGLSVLFFAFHWRWLRAQEQLERAKAAV